MRDYLEYVDAIETAFRDAEKIPSPQSVPAHKVASSDTAPIVIIAPHPDDEMLIGALALRFQRQCGRRIVCLSTTLGSKRERQAARWEELKNACAEAGFEPRTFGEHGLEHITPDARAKGGEWNDAVNRMASVLAEMKPAAVFFPHEKDANRTHMGVHLLAMDALAKAAHPCVVFETEFWSPMTNPNLCVECPKEDLAKLIAALAYHVGEVARNPYHLRLPAWMIDNVRRGGEIVGGQGGEAPSFTFATLYRRAYWDGCRMKEIQASGRFVSAPENPENLLAVV